MPTSTEGGTPSFEIAPLRVGRLLNVKQRSELKRISEEIIARRGPPTVTAAQPMSILYSAARKLFESGGDLDALTNRERKGAIELFWTVFSNWRPGPGDVSLWLSWAGREWATRVGVRRIATSFVRNFDPNSDATRQVGEWLSDRIDLVPGRFGEFLRKHDLHRGSVAVFRISRALAAGDTEFLIDADKDPYSEAVIRGSGFMVALIADFGRRCHDNSSHQIEVAAKKLRSYLGDYGVAGARGSEEMRGEARIQMVSGIVRWASRVSAGEAEDTALSIVDSLAGDPRISLTHWRGIDEGIRHKVEEWLTKRTLENMFRVIDDLKVDRPDMWQSRRAFWFDYLPYIRRAFLMCADDAVPYAAKLGEKCGVLKHSGEHRHCGLLMEIVGPEGDRLIVLDLNMRASALFWKAGSINKPAFYEAEYDTRQLRLTCDERVRHMTSWEERFARLIESETGIRRPLGLGGLRG